MRTFFRKIIEPVSLHRSRKGGDIEGELPPRRPRRARCLRRRLRGKPHPFFRLFDGPRRSLDVLLREPADLRRRGAITGLENDFADKKLCHFIRTIYLVQFHQVVEGDYHVAVPLGCDHNDVFQHEGGTRLEEGPILFRDISVNLREKD